MPLLLFRIKSIIEDRVAEQLLDQLKKLPKPSDLVNAENKDKFHISSK